MKVILYMAMTANGYIADLKDNVEWISEDSWNSYLAKVKEIGVAVIGKRTYDLMKSNEFVKGCKYYVLSDEENTSNAEFIKSPEEIKEENYCICGGGITNSLFINQITEIYLDIEPIILGKGIKLFADADFEVKLELLETKQMGNTIQLHYKVLR